MKASHRRGPPSSSSCARFASSFLTYRIMVTPDLFGDGKRLFDEGRPAIALKLLEAKALDTGAVILHYRPDRNS